MRGAEGKLPDLPPLADTLRALMPVNPIASAAGGAIVPVVIFALLLAIAMRQIDSTRAAAITDFFSTVADTLLVIIGWVLIAAPMGVFALAFDVAARSGFPVGALLAWYVLARVIGGVVRPVQGWPVIVQAGASGAGRQLAAAGGANRD